MSTFSIRVDIEKDSEEVTLPSSRIVFFFHKSALGMVPFL